jgi:predicted GNAT family acetyltransferase
MNAQVVDNGAMLRFELPLGEEAVAAIHYRYDAQGRLVLVHTQVPAEYAGQGHATRLVVGALDLIRQSGRKAIFRCPFLLRYLKSHPEHYDLVAG